MKPPGWLPQLHTQFRGKFSQFDARCRNKTTQNRKIVSFYSKFWLSFEWMPRNYFNQSVLSLLPIRHGGRSILINAWRKCKPSPLFFNQWTSNFQVALLGVTWLFVKHHLFSRGTQRLSLPTRLSHTLLSWACFPPLYPEAMSESGKSDYSIPVYTFLGMLSAYESFTLYSHNRESDWIKRHNTPCGMEN